MKAKILDIKGKEKGDIELNDSVYKIEPVRDSIYQSIKNELANRRQGTSSTKTKAEVQGSGTKPYRQKGTGRARVGTKRNPVWRGGGIAFGPKPRDYSYRINKKLKRLAYRSVLSLKNSEGNLKVIEKFELENSKTKDLVNILNNIVKGEKSTLIVNDDNNALSIKRAGRNVPWIRCLSFNRMNVHALYYSKNIVLLEDAALELNKFLDK